MESFAIREFNAILLEESHDIASELVAMLRALTSVEDTTLVRSNMASPDEVEWGWGFWW